MYAPWVRNMTIQQGADFWAGKDKTQFLDIKIEDGEDGAYLVLRTARWALSAEEIPSFCSWLLRLCKDSNTNTTKFLSETNFPEIILSDNTEDEQS